MDVPTTVIFSDPVLLRIFFDLRRFAPRSKRGAGAVASHDQTISEYKVKFLKTKRVAVAEYWQHKMRQEWLEIRELCDGYFIDLPAGHDDGCEHVEQFAYASDADELKPNWKARAAYWYRFEQRSPPAWPGHNTAWNKRITRRRRRRPV